MRENKVKTIWGNGGAVLNGWLHIASSFAAEIMAHTDFDSLTIDMQHGPVGYESAVSMLQAISTTDTTPLARVPWNEPGIIMQMLDAGCYGIICPMVNTREECEAFVGACLYPPMGYRSNGPTRVRLYAGDDYAVQSNETVLPIAMIETAQALENRDEIMSVPGLAGIYIGPADLSITLQNSMPPNIMSDQNLEAIDKILASAKAHNIGAGIHTGSVEMARMMIDKGFQFVTIQSDASFMSNHAKLVIDQIKGEDAAQSSKTDGIY